MHDVLDWSASTLRMGTPLALAALGGFFSERCGLVNICLEGKMLFSAFIAASVAAASGDPWLALLAAVLAGCCMAVMYGVFAMVLRADQIVAGTAINLLAFGLVPLLNKAWFGNTGGTPALGSTALFTQAPLWIMVISVGLIWSMQRFTVIGLWHRVAGDNPHALDAAGVSVNGLRWWALLVSGGFAGAAGASLSIFLSSSFSRDMTAGRGFMALAALILGRWKPVPSALACLFFSGLDALQIRLQTSSTAALPAIKHLLQVFPYLATLIVLAGVAGAHSTPAAIGQLFRRGESR